MADRYCTDHISMNYKKISFYSDMAQRVDLSAIMAVPEQSETDMFSVPDTPKP